jgi:hypothetical protein
MPFLIHERIEVRLAAGGTVPAAFRWRGRCYAIGGVAACWRAMGPWWDGEGERTYFRVVAHDGEELARSQEDDGLYELCYDHGTRRWLLETVVD